MATIHIYLPASLRARLDSLIENEGFKGPSEFVRFMIKYFEYIPPTPKFTNLKMFRGGQKYPGDPSNPLPNYFTFYPLRQPRKFDGEAKYL